MAVAAAGAPIEAEAAASRHEAKVKEDNVIITHSSEAPFRQGAGLYWNYRKEVNYV